MELQYKPDFSEACKYWEAFWQREIVDRPCIAVTAPKKGCIQVPKPARMFKIGVDYEAATKIFNQWASTTSFGGESIPFFQISFGPDQFSSFLGAELVWSERTQISWVVPFINDWRKNPRYIWKVII